MKIAIGSDHAGFLLKNALVEHLKSKEYEVLDLGTDNPDEAVDYPDFAQAVAQAAANREADKGIIVCGSGVGASIVANKVKGAYAGLCHDTYSAHQGVEHDNMNVLCMGSRVIGIALATGIVDMFVGAQFEVHEERFVKRHQKVLRIEKKMFGSR